MDALQYQNSSTLYDNRFQKVRGLAWLPWVGQHFSDRPPHQRLLVVGESHYYKGDTPEQRQAERESWLKDLQSTRDVVSEQLVNHEYLEGNKTLDTIPKLLFKTSEIDQIDHWKLWEDSAYYNFIQRPVEYNKGGIERPTWDDYIAGWNVFAEIVIIIQPSHCLFVGVTAAKSFSAWIASQNKFSGDVTITQKINGAWGRVARLDLAGKTTELMFVRHLGKYFSWIKWHDYLRFYHVDFMGWLGKESYVTAQKV